MAPASLPFCTSEHYDRAAHTYGKSYPELARAWNRIMAQYPADYQLNLPDGVVVKGREEAAKLFANFVKPHDQGGLCGMKFTPEQTFVVGETLNIQWKAEAEFLTEPYKGSDAYETHDGLMVAMVSTFKGADMKLKK
jgi:hypothetical protein